MIIIIPYRQEIHNGLELRYALRSIQKYLTGWDDIILVGDRPDWYLGGSIHHIDHSAAKNFNIYSKILTACQNGISENFVMWHDDHFLTQATHVSDIKYWHNGSLSKELMSIKNGEVRTAGGRYRKAIEHTIEITNDQILNWDIHVPIIFNKKRFHDLFQHRTDELCVKSFYCHRNSFLDPAIIANSEFMDDLKIPFQMPYERLKEKIGDRIFFSIDSAAIGDDLIRLWNELYPGKSKFEL